MQRLTFALLGSTAILAAGGRDGGRAEPDLCGRRGDLRAAGDRNSRRAHADIDVNMVRLSSGEAYAKIRAESRNPQTDLWWAGTGDPHLQAAADGLTAEYKSPMLDQLQPWAVKQAEVSGWHTVGVYSGALGWGYNTEIFKAEGPDPAEVLGRPDRPGAEGRDRDRRSELVGHRLHDARHAGADHGRGRGLRLSQEAERQRRPVHQVGLGAGQGGGARRDRPRHRVPA